MLNFSTFGVLSLISGHRNPWLQAYIVQVPSSTHKCIDSSNRESVLSTWPRGELMPYGAGGSRSIRVSDRHIYFAGNSRFTNGYPRRIRRAVGEYVPMQEEDDQIRRQSNEMACRVASPESVHDYTCTSS